jgi:hypothetical protein
MVSIICKDIGCCILCVRTYWMLSFICKDILDVVFYLDILFVGAAMFVAMVAGVLVTDSCDVLFADSCDAKTCY